MTEEKRPNDSGESRRHRIRDGMVETISTTSNKHKQLFAGGDGGDIYQQPPEWNNMATKEKEIA